MTEAEKKQVLNHQSIGLNLHKDVLAYYTNLAKRHGMTRNSVIQWVLANYKLNDMKW